MKKKTIDFTKMSGAGNDFLVIEEKKGVAYKRLAPKMCDRSNGIGADGLLLLGKSRKNDFRMRIINSDGSEAEMCGNGARCMAAYISAIKKPKKKLFSMETIAGKILGEAKDEVANVRLSDPKDYRPNIEITINSRKIHVHYIDTGVPHTLVYVNNLDNIDVKTIGKKIRYHKKFKPRGTNVNFVEQLKKNLVAVRTYERGVENETKACGTGSVAAGLISYLETNTDVTNKANASMNVLTKSGDKLLVKFDIHDNKITNVWLKGNAKFIAQGKYFI